MLKVSELIVDLYDCQSDLDDEEFLRSTLESAANKVNAKIIQRITQKYSPSGISVILILAETHISVHTWPEYRYAALDVFICGEGKDPETVWEVVKESLRPASFNINRIVRTVGNNRQTGACLRDLPVH